MTIRFEQVPNFDGVDRSDLPASEKVRTAAWFDEFKQPVVRCSFVARQVTDVHVGPDTGAPVFAVEVEHDPETGVLRIGGLLKITVRGLDLSLEVSDEIVSHLRLRRWRLFGAESAAPWTE